VCAFTPPTPAPLPQGASLLQRLSKGLKSSLSLIASGSYTRGGVGRMALHTLPFLRKRMVYIVREPEDIRGVLQRAGDYPKSELMNHMLGALTGYSIFVSNGPVWERQRRMMDPAFEQARIADVFPLMKEAADACVARFAEYAKAPEEAAPVDVEMTHFAGDIIFRTIYSEPMTGDVAQRIFSAFDVFQEVAYAHGMLRLSNVPTSLLPGAWRAKRAAKAIRAQLEKPLRRRLDAVARGEATSEADILSTLMNVTDPVTGTKFDEGELLDQIAMLFLAGHETSAAGLSWSLYLLAKSPDTQAKLRAEADAVLDDREIAYADIRRLTLARDVFREAMRLYPPVAFVARDATCPERLQNREVTPGSVLFLAPYIMHRHQDHWDRPECFDPERFQTPRGKEGVKKAYFPFSMGPRVCPGAAFALQEAPLVLAELVRRYDFAPVDGHEPEPAARLTLRSANGLPLRVRPRPDATPSGD